MFLRRVVLAGGAALFAAVAVKHSGEDSIVSAVQWPPALTRRWDPNWDRREPRSLANLNDLKGNEDLKFKLKKYKARARRTIFLVCHGQYNMAGETDPEKLLTPLGREQANLTGQRLADLGYTYKEITYSTLQRAKETSEIIGQHLRGVTQTGSDLLIEGHPIRPDPSSDCKPDVVYFEDGPRIESAFRSYIHRADYDQKGNSYEIIVCHDNVIRYLVCRALQFPPEAWLRMDLNHGSITELVIHHNGHVTLRMLGEAGYMPASKLSC
ncbi:serine/threonine-protein phosphatase PGAM5, mitochondrial-like [Aquarana catesbeiana]|uniref:serine/threonine-protein phosphatase PGAM5, mitochondrial-like n=1 Tax=Aquarana catesbeiana TaxID=8400 RepID=UPI003CC9E1B4